VAASILSARLLADGLPDERGYTLSFAIMTAALCASVAASLAVPGGMRRRARGVVLGEPRPNLE
jgi:hypothetical protein